MYIKAFQEIERVRWELQEGEKRSLASLSEGQVDEPSSIGEDDIE